MQIDEKNPDFREESLFDPNIIEFKLINKPKTN